MFPLAETVAFIFGLVALGYAAGRISLLPDEAGDSLTSFAISVAVPLLLFRTMAHADFGGSPPWRLWTVYFAAVAVAWSTAQVLTVHAFGRDKRAGVVGGLSGSFSNIALLGIPLLLGVYGQEGFEIMSLILSIHLPIMMAASLLLFAWLGGQQALLGTSALLRDFAVNLFSNPLIIGIISGLLWRVSGLEMPSLMTRLVDAIANVAAPVALFAVGLGLRRYGIKGNVRPALAMAALKLFFMPAVVLLLALATGLGGLSAKVAVATAALPLGVNPYLIASRFGTGQALASNTMSISTACAVLTTAFWLSVAEWVFG